MHPPQANKQEAAKSSDSGAKSAQRIFTREQATARLEERLRFRRPKEEALRAISRFVRVFSLPDELELVLKLLEDQPLRGIVTPGAPFNAGLQRENRPADIVIEEIRRSDKEA